MVPICLMTFICLDWSIHSRGSHTPGPRASTPSRSTEAVLRLKKLPLPATPTLPSFLPMSACRPSSVIVFVSRKQYCHMFSYFLSGNLHFTATLGSAPPPCPILPRGSIQSLLYYQPLMRPKQPQLCSATSWFTVRQASRQITSNFDFFCSSADQEMRR